MHENKKITDQIEKLDCIYDEIKQVLQLSKIDESVDDFNIFENHPKIFFSQQEIKRNEICQVD